MFLARSRVFALILVILPLLGGCILRPQQVYTGGQVVVTQQAPIVVRQPQPMVVMTQPAPIVVRQPAPAQIPVRVAPRSSVANGAITYPRQRIRYPLQISYPRRITIYVDGHGLDPTVAVYDGYGQRIAFNDDSGDGLDSQLTLTMNAGSYLVEVAGWSSSTGPFTLTVN